MDSHSFLEPFFEPRQCQKLTSPYPNSFACQDNKRLQSQDQIDGTRGHKTQMIPWIQTRPKPSLVPIGLTNNHARKSRSPWIQPWLRSQCTSKLPQHSDLRKNLVWWLDGRIEVAHGQEWPRVPWVQFHHVEA